MPQAGSKQGDCVAALSHLLRSPGLGWGTGCRPSTSFSTAQHSLLLGLQTIHATHRDLYLITVNNHSAFPSTGPSSWRSVNRFRATSDLGSGFLSLAPPKPAAGFPAGLFEYKPSTALGGKVLMTGVKAGATFCQLVSGKN